jgi:hypothetical protein
VGVSGAGWCRFEQDERPRVWDDVRSGVDQVVSVGLACQHSELPAAACDCCLALHHRDWLWLDYSLRGRMAGSSDADAKRGRVVSRDHFVDFPVPRPVGTGDHPQGKTGREMADEFPVDEHPARIRVVRVRRSCSTSAWSPGRASDTESSLNDTPRIADTSGRRGAVIPTTVPGGLVYAYEPELDVSVRYRQPLHSSRRSSSAGAAFTHDRPRVGAGGQARFLLHAWQGHVDGSYGFASRIAVHARQGHPAWA